MTTAFASFKRKFATARSLFRIWIVDAFFGVIPRLVFGNSAGLVNNFDPLLRTAFSGPRRSATPSALAQRDAAALKDQGYVMIAPSYDRTMFEELVRKFRRVIEDKDLSRPNSKYSVEVKDPYGSIPELGALLNSYVNDLLAAYFGRPFYVVETQCFRTYPIPEWDREREAYSNFWHCDGYPVSWVKVYLFLSDWDELSGPTELMPIVKTKRIMRSGYVNRYFSPFSENRMGLDSLQAVKPVGAAGHGFIFNPQRCIHRAGIPRAGRFRDAMMFFLADRRVATLS